MFIFYCLYKGNRGMSGYLGENKEYFYKSVFVVCNIWEKVHQLHIVGNVVD